jgi:hypothetical protein
MFCESSSKKQKSFAKLKRGTTLKETDMETAKEGLVNAFHVRKSSAKLKKTRKAIAVTGRGGP